MSELRRTRCTASRSPYYAWAGDTEASEIAYRRAVELGTEATYDLDVENALWALTSLYGHGGPPFWERMQTANEMAVSVDGTRSFVPMNARTRQRALRELADPKGGAEAHMWLRHEFWEGLIGGCLAVELEAMDDLAQLYERSGFGEAALHLSVSAGDAKRAGDLAKKAPAWIDLSASAQSPAKVGT